MKVVQPSVVASVAIVVMSLAASAEEPARDPRQKIEAIVNRNPAPAISGEIPDMKVTVPAGYDWKEHARVVSALKDLASTSDEAFPLLLEAINDNRHCMTFNTGQSIVNYTVGDICRSVAHSTLVAGYHNDLPPNQRAYKALIVCELIPDDSGDYPKWYRERQSSGHSLADLQVENARLAIKKLALLDYVGREVKSAAIARIELRIEAIERNKRALPASTGLPPNVGRPIRQ